MMYQFVVIALVVGMLVACENATNKSTSVNNSPAVVVPMIAISEGEFIMGSNKEDTEGIQQQYGFPNTLYQDEHPQHKKSLKAFYIDIYEVSNQSYKEFVKKSKRLMPYTWVNNGYNLDSDTLELMTLEKLRVIAIDYFKLDLDVSHIDKPNLVAAMRKHQTEYDKYPVDSINWFNAKAYCEWRSARLPTEAEWEKAARGSTGLEYPWGNEWDPTKTNTGDDSKWENGIAPIGSYESNKSPFGVYDMSGNVWEWVADWYEPYEGSTYKTERFGQKNKVIRGGGGGVGHYAISYFFRAATRQFSEPEMESEDVGFRCAKDL